MVLACVFLGFGLAVLAYGIRLAFWEQTVKATVNASQLVAQLKDLSLPTAERVSACMRLANFKADAKEAVPALLGAVRDPSFNVRCTAVYVLGRFGTNSAEACPFLFRLLRDWKTGGSSEGLSESYLTGSLTLSPEQNRYRNLEIWLETVTEALMEICPAESKVISTLAYLLDDNDQDVVMASCRILSGVATNLGPAEAKLIQLTQKNDEFLKVSALCALGKPKPAEPLAMATIVDALSDPRAAVRECSLDLLGDFGSSSAPAVKSILTVLVENRAEVIDPKYLLKNLNPPLSANANKQSYPALQYSLPSQFGSVRKNRPSHIRYKALQALAEIGPAASEALPSVMKIVQDNSDPLRLTAAVTAFRLGISYNSILPAFTQALSDSTEDTRRIALGELTRIAKSCPGVVSVLARGLEDQSISIRVATVQALSKIGTNVLSVFPAIEKATRDPKAAVRETAIQLVEQLSQGKP